jgi:hypothetical protein
LFVREDVSEKKQPMNFFRWVLDLDPYAIMAVIISPCIMAPLHDRKIVESRCEKWCLAIAVALLCIFFTILFWTVRSSGAVTLVLFTGLYAFAWVASETRSPAAPIWKGDRWVEIIPTKGWLVVG